MGSGLLTFGEGFVQDRNTARVTAQVDSIVDAGGTESRLLKWARRGSTWTYFSLEWNATKVCVLREPELQLLALGADGTVLVGSAAGGTEEIIDDSAQGPRGRGPLNDLRIIGGRAYVVGMGRQAYRREANGIWSRQDAGTLAQLGELQVCGFNSIDGLDESELYAVGFNGEIWRRLAGRWSQIASPTNLILHKARMVSTTEVYACGQMGVVLTGHGDLWQRLEQDETDEDFWGMEYFRDRLYLACDGGLFRLLPGDGIEPVNVGLGDEWTCRYLHAADGVLWSFGPKHIAWTEDAKKWHDVTP